MEIIGDIKNYDWGKFGLDSEVAQLQKLNLPSFVPDNSTPYSELWFGDHPSGPAKIKATGEDLKTFISKNRERFIGGHEQLTFLFKVLSIRKALSIQVHPNKEEAEKLHNSFPDIYKDPNHKPELAISLTAFLGLCGFRPYEEVKLLCNKFLPLKVLLTAKRVENLNSPEGLKECFSTLMNSNTDEIALCICEIAKSHTEDLKQYNLLEIFNTLNRDFPNDVGILCLFFLNVVRLQPGEAIFLAANEPHAYLQGDVVECMACSDNVIRAGLTPKYKDVSSLIRLLNYEGQPAEKKLFQPIKKDPFLELFAPTVKDFAVVKLNLPTEENTYKWENSPYGCILLVLQGERILQMDKYDNLLLKRGSSVFIPSECKSITFATSKEASIGNFVAYIAMHNHF